MKIPTLIAAPNSSIIAGMSASAPAYFGEFNRYKVMAVHTRFDAVAWFVFDAEQEDEVTGKPAVIRQEDTQEAAVLGLES